MHSAAKRALPLLFLLTGIPVPALASAGPAITATTDAVSQALVAILIVSVFAMLAMEKAHRVLVIFAAVAVMWLVTYLTPYHLIPFDAAKEAIDLNVIVLLAAMMAVVGVLKTTGVFSWAVGRLLRTSGGSPVAIVTLVIWFTGLLSSVADNVTTVIFATPMALEIASRLRIRPIAILLPIVMAANIGGTATLIGDPPNILIGSGAGLSFMAFVINLAAPVLIMLVVLQRYSSRYFAGEYAAGIQQIDARTLTSAPLTDPVLLRWGLAITALIFAGFFTHSLTGMPVSIPAAVGAAALFVVQDILHLRSRDPAVHERHHGVIKAMEADIEWPTLAFFALLFIAVGAAVATGLVGTLSSGLARFIDWGAANLGLSANGTLLFAALLILWVSGALSAVIDNIPYVAVTIPIIASLTERLPGDTEILWWALALGACLGGNGTVIGASANVTVIGLAERSGVHITFRQFARLGVRVVGITLLISSAYLAAHIYFGQATTQGAMLAVLALYFIWQVSRSRSG